MAGPRLLRRREVWVPTVWGWLLLVSSCVAIVLLAGLGIHPFLAPWTPVPGADVLVVEGWLSTDDLDQAVGACRRGAYRLVLTTGGPLEARPGSPPDSSYAALAASYLSASGLGDVPVVPVPAPASAQDRTFLSAVMVRQHLAAHYPACRALDLFSSGVHSRRTRHLFRLALGPKIQVGILAAEPAYDAARWWGSSAGAKSVLTESVGLLWVACFFHPPAPGSHEELWAVPRGGAVQPERRRASDEEQ